MTFKLILNIIISIFMVLGAVDYIIGGKLGVSEEFERSFTTMGKIALSIVGMICLAPLIAKVLSPIVTPFYRAIGIDPGMFISLILPPDSGAYTIAMEMTENTEIGMWSGTVVASQIGAAFAFTIPTCLGIISSKQYKFFSVGALSGLIACPFGCILGGLLCHIPILTVLYSLVPAIIISLIIILLLIFKPEKIMKAFQIFGKILRVIIIFGLILAGIDRLTGFAVIKGLAPISDGFLIAGTITLSMTGVLIFTKIAAKVLSKPLSKFSAFLGISELSILHVFNATCVAIPGAVAYEEMDNRGKVVFAAFVVTAANIFGAHLSYIGINCPDHLGVTVIAKFFSGALGIALAVFFSKRILEKDIPNTIAE